MSSEQRPSAPVAILLGGGVREALMAQSVVRACEGATVFTSFDALGTLLGLGSVGRALVFDDSPAELLRVFRRLRSGPYTTAVLPYPSKMLHAALVYFAAVPRRMIVSGPSDWAASERLPRTDRLHPVEANWQLAVATSNRPMRASGEPPRLQPPDAVRHKVVASWPSFLGGARPLVLIPGGGNWATGRPGPIWPAERFAVVANQSTADRVVLISGAGDDRAVRETRAGIVKPTLIVNLADLTVEEAAVISELSLAVIGHDGDALHVAAAAGALVLAIARRPDVPPMGERVVTSWVDDFDRFPARPIVETLSAQARVDSYA
jgi:ADP-heptose:LPS heptosyltransferase